MVSPAQGPSKGTRWAFALCAGFYALTGLGIPEAGAADLWPLRLSPPAITGTFMEPRAAHYHSGLDIRTGGRIGVEVIAPASGWIERVRVSPKGYGKAVYLHADDGRVFVFAHLSAFATSIQEQITARWQSERRYQQDLSFEANRIRFAAGDLIALSGATGTGAPHLHVEIRGPDGRPRNPLRHGLEFADDRPPRIQGLRLVALSDDAWIEGGVLEREVRADETLRASGTLGLEIRCADFAPHANFPLMPYEIELVRAGEVLYAMQQDRFDFAQSGQMRLEIRRQNGGRWIRLYAHEQNRLPGRKARPLQLLADGEQHALELRVRDAAGNAASVAFTIVGARDAEPASAPSIEFGERHLQLQAPDQPGAVWRLRSDAGERMLVGATHRVAYDRLPALPLWCAWVDADGQTRFEREIRGSLGGHRGSSGWSETLTATDPGDGLFAGGLLRCEAAERPAELPADVEWVGPAHQLQLCGAAFDRDLLLRLPLEELQGLFLRDRAGNWSLLDREGEDWLLGEEGSLAVLRDAQPPRIGSWRLADGSELRDGDALTPQPPRQDGIGGAHWPSVLLPLADAAAGLDADGIVALLDGEPWPARWDPEDEFVAFDFFVDPGPGEHRLEVRARDRLGNAAESGLGLRFARP